MTEHFDTKAVHLNSQSTIESKSKTRPIYQTSVFSFENLDDLEAYFRGDKDFLYTRMGNPNVNDLASSVAHLEGAPKGVATASGMSAILTGILSVVERGGHIVAPKDLYGGTYQLLVGELEQFGIEVSLVSFTEPEHIREAIKENTRLLYSESVTNPLLRVENIEEIICIANEYNIRTMIDNTFATPYLLQPYKQGVDLVVHSATKYIAGHSDVTAGVLVGDAELIEKADQRISNLGANLSPFEAWLGCRGLKTLHVRMARHVENAERLATALQNNKAVASLYYPRNVSTKGNGAIITIDITNTCDIRAFFESLSWVKIVPSLAGCETSVSYPAGTSHRSLPEKMREELGITNGLVRISVGLEDIDDLIQEFEQALEKALR